MHNMALSSIRFTACRLDTDLPKVQVSMAIYFLKIHDTTDGPLIYSPVVAPLTVGMVNIEHIHDIEHAILLYLTYTLVATNQQFRYRVFRDKIWAKNGVNHITFECVPAQHQPNYFLTECNP